MKKLQYKGVTQRRRNEIQMLATKKNRTTGWYVLKA
jgi:hypothetical protein